MSGGAIIDNSLRLISDVVLISGNLYDIFKKECTDLARRLSLLSHLLEEIKDSSKNYLPSSSSSSSSSSSDCSSDSCLFDLSIAIQGAKRWMLSANKFDEKNSNDGAARKILFQFQCVTWKLEKVLGNLPYNQYDISEEVLEQVNLVRMQLKRASERYSSPLNTTFLERAIPQPLDKEMDPHQPGNKTLGSLHVHNIDNIDHITKVKPTGLPKSTGLKDLALGHIIHVADKLKDSSTSSEVCSSRGSVGDTEDNPVSVGLDENKKSDSSGIPEDFLCPISLDLMRNPVIVSTGQTYERSCIQRWIDCGNKRCPKTQQELQNLTLTPNYALRNLISQWCVKNNIEQPLAITYDGRIKMSDGSLRDVSGDIAAIEFLVSKLSSGSVDECRAAVFKIRSMSKRSTDNRILIAEAGAIPVLVNLLTCEDNVTQENAVTSILNLSLYESNKELIMLACAIGSIVQVLRAGSMEARENAAATLFSLSLVDKNKIIIGASGAIPALVELLQNGNTRGKKDASTALFNLCIYHENKDRAVRAGIITALLKMLTDATNCIVHEALMILSVLVSHLEAKAGIVEANTIPVLIDLLRTGLPHNKENAAAILLDLCKGDPENLSCLSRLGAVVPLSELAMSGSDRAKRKATSLLEHIRNP